MLKEEEEKQLKTLLGQLNWIASQTRPDLGSCFRRRFTVEHKSK